MEAVVSLFGANPVAITFPESNSSPSLLDLKRQLFDIYQIPIEEQRIQTAGGLPLSTGNDDDDEHVFLFEESQDQNQDRAHGAAAMVKCFGLSMRMSGGKGGFGSMLRAQGGRMSSQKSTNTDACRDLSGRRIKTVNDAKKMAEYVQQEPEREKARKETLKRKIEEKLEMAERPTRKHRFEDSKFFDEAEEQVEEVKSAVAASIKASMKTGSSSSSSSSSSSASSPTAAGNGKGKGKAIEALEKKKPMAKSLGMWDDMSDYESSEEEDEEDEEEEEEEEEDAKVPSVGSSSSSSRAKSTRATKSKAK
ncbi:hypothetical protein EDD11_006707 [Mortierella claussenii]|nr:hypothetical protein EDD11_006707 [Mortierella claussenii]